MITVLLSAAIAMSQPAAAQAERWEPIAGTNRPTEVDRSDIVREGGAQPVRVTAWIRIHQPDGSMQTVRTEIRCRDRTFRGLFLIQRGADGAEIRMDGGANPAQKVEPGTDPEHWLRALCTEASAEGR